MILVYLEHDRGLDEPANLEAITLAKKLDDEVNLVAIGADARPVAEDYSQCGPVYLAEHDILTDYAPVAWARSVGQLAQKLGVEAVIAPGTERCNAVLAHLGAQLGQPLSTNTVEVTRGDSYEVTRLRWGSSLLERARLHGAPKLITVAPGAFPRYDAAGAPKAAVESFTPELSAKDEAGRLTSRTNVEGQGITLNDAPVVVGGGRGVGSAEGFAVLEELAAKIGGVVGGSRVATNNGWRPHSDQVGLTGNRISPKLYIACGISGAIQHIVGCKGAEKILVINKDRDASFFSKADYGVEGDLHEVVQAVIEQLEK